MRWGLEISFCLFYNSCIQMLPMQLYLLGGIFARFLLGVSGGLDLGGEGGGVVSERE